MNNAKTRALKILSGTRTYASGTPSAFERIGKIYSELKNAADLPLARIVSLLREALECKQVPPLLIKGLVKQIDPIIMPMKETVQLFCFPYAGGSALAYKNWADSLPGHTVQKTVEYPGRGVKSHLQSLKSLCELLDHLEAEILPQAKEPFAFFGHSLGAIVGYELAKRFAVKHGRPPSILFLSASPAPSKIGDIASISSLDDEAFIEKVESLNGVPKGLVDEPEFTTHFLPILRVDFSLLEGYRPAMDTKLNMPLMVYGGQDDPYVDINDLALWSLETTQQVTLRVMPGDHFFIRDPEELLKDITNHLNTYAIN